MGRTTVTHLGLSLALIALLSACGGGERTVFGKTREERIADQSNPMTEAQQSQRSTIWDLFENKDDPNVTVRVNRYLWNATLEVLDFMPIESADPFSGVITYGYGTPPGGGRAYSGTVLINDPALDARALTLSLRTRGGPISAEAQRQVEDAILTRARQLRMRDSRL